MAVTGKEVINFLMMCLSWNFVLLLVFCSDADYVSKEVDIEFYAKKGPVRIFTADQIAEYDGSDPSQPIYMAVKGVVFDVSSGKEFYAKGTSYNLLAGKDASRAVAKMSLESADLTHDLTGVEGSYLKALDEIFESTYVKKYPIVGFMDYLVESKPQNYREKPIDEL